MAERNEDGGKRPTPEKDKLGNRELTQGESLRRWVRYKWSEKAWSGKSRGERKREEKAPLNKESGMLFSVEVGQTLSV